MTIRFSVTGQIVVGVEGRAVDERRLPSGQARLALAMLVLERHRPVHREELADALWPGQLPASWEPSLRAVVSKVRAFLAEAGLPASELLTNAFGCYQLHLPADAEVDVETAASALEQVDGALAAGDVERAEALAAEARAVASRPLLPGLSGPWVEQRRDEQRLMLVRALESHGEALLAAGRPHDAAAVAHQVIDLEPLRESGHRLLMSALAGGGNRAEALRAYERCRRLLAEELGAFPSPETEEAYLRLLNEEAAPPPRRPSTKPAVPPVLAALASTPLVGRRPECRAIATAWRDAVAGQRRVLLVGGEPGIGKTRLAAEAARVAAAGGGTVLLGRADAELGVPYLPFAEALGAYVAGMEPGEATARLGPLAGELSRLLPTLPQQVPGLAAPVTAEAEIERYRLFEAVIGWLAAAAAVRPLALILEDLQWAGKPALLLLRHVVRSSVPMRLLVVGTYRDVDLGVDHPLAETVTGLPTLPGVERRVLAGLTEEEVEELLGDASDQRLASTLHAHTDGNPFFVQEMLRHLLDTGAVRRAEDHWELLRPPAELGAPEAVRDVIGLQLAGLSPDATTLVEIGAVIGRQFDVRLAGEVSGLEEDRCLKALEDLRRAGLVVPLPGPRDRQAFTHDLVRWAVYEQIAPPRRMRLHLRVGRALEARPDADRWIGELAHHFTAAAGLGETDRAVLYRRRAGDQARERLAFEEAADHYRQALAAVDLAPVPDVGVRCDLRTALGETLRRAGDADHRSVLLDAVTDARSLGDHRRIGLVGLALNTMGVPSTAGRDDTTVAVLEEALAGVGDDDPVLRARLLAVLAAEEVWSGDVERRVRLGREAVELARRAAEPAILGRVLIARHLATSGPDNLAERLDEADELVALGTRLGDLELTCRGHLFRFDALMEQGDRAGGDAALEMAAEPAGQLQQFFAWEVALRRAGVALLEGRLEEAERLAETALDVGQARGVSVDAALAVYGAQLLMLRSEQGRIAELVDMVVSLAESQPTLTAWPVVLSFVHADCGRADQARRALAPLAAGGFAAIPRDIPWLGSMVMLARVCAIVDAPDAAETLYTLLAPFAGRMAWGVGLAAGPTDLGLGLAAAVAGRLDEADRHLAAAEDLCSRMGARAWLARASAERARLPLRRGQVGGVAAGPYD